MKLYVAVAYISGPMRFKSAEPGPRRWRPRLNADAFLEAKVYMQGLGYRVFSPIDNDLANGVDLDDTTTYPTDDKVQELLEWDLRAVLKSDVIVMLPGWRQSRGARLEQAVAKDTGRTVLYWTQRKRWMLSRHRRRRGTVR